MAIQLEGPLGSVGPGVGGTRIGWCLRCWRWCGRELAAGERLEGEDVTHASVARCLSKTCKGKAVPKSLREFQDISSPRS
jgi:hypothetical protein